VSVLITALPARWLIRHIQQAQGLIVADRLNADTRLLRQLTNRVTHLLDSVVPYGVRVLPRRRQGLLIRRFNDDPVG